MGLYDAVDRNGPNRKGEKTLRKPLLIAAILFVAFTALVLWTLRYQLQYRACFSALTDATRSARRTTGTCAMHQRQLTEAIKRARQIALLPFVTE